MPLDPCRRLVALLQSVIVGPLVAQLRLDTDCAALAAWLEAVAPRLQRAAPADAEQLARLGIARLRLGDAAGAAAALDLLTTLGQDDPTWELVLHAAIVHATRDATRARTELASLERRLAAVELGSAPSSYAEGSMRVHARYCLGLIAAAHHVPGADVDATRHERLATNALLRLEQDTWQPGRGHFRPTPRRGELAMPEPAEPSLLLPCSAGMVLASGERMLRHLRTVLDAARERDPHRWRTQHERAPDTSLLLAAAATLADDDQRAAAWRLPWPDAAATPGSLAAHVDAVLFSITGMRVAVGGGSDPNWLRLAPWLPPGTSHVRLQGMLTNGRRLDLELEAGTAELCVRLRFDDPAGHGPLRTLVAGRGQQIVTELIAGQTFECRLPAR